MLLKSLLITRRGETMRQVNFKRGLNLVVDTTSNVPTDSGNSVGKTTFLRIIDYCLGGKGTPIFTDPEFGTVNDQIHGFLTQGGVRFELTIEHQDGRTHLIERSFETEPRIDGQEYTLKEFNIELGKLLFGIHGPKPSARQLLNKFIRIDTQQITNTVNFLHGTARSEDYAPVYLYLFGFKDFETLARRREAVLRLRRLERQRKALKSLSQDKLKQMLLVIDRDIAALEDKLRKFQVADAVKNEVSALEEKRKAISELTLELSGLRVKLNLNRQTIKNLEQANSKIDTSTVKRLYSQAERLIPNLQTKFEELVSFHEQMIANKTKFVRQSISEIEGKISKIEPVLAEHLREEEGLLKKLSDKGALTDLQKLQKELFDLYQQKGDKEAISKQLGEISREIIDAEEDLKKIDTVILSYRGELEKRITEFNLTFSQYCKQLYGEEYVVSFHIDDSREPIRFELSIDKVRGNVGSGKKRAEVTAFDLAYLKLLDENDADTVRFTLHDKVEEIHDNQIKTLFEIANAIDGQYIVAVLRGKLMSLSDDFIRDNTILSLSQQEKFFRLA